MKSRLFLLLVLYSVATFLMVAILRWVLFYLLEFNLYAPDALVLTRVFLSAPFLIIIGIILIAVYKRWWHRVAGIVFTFSGFAWLITLIRTIILESA